MQDLETLLALDADEVKIRELTDEYLPPEVCYFCIVSYLKRECDLLPEFLASLPSGILNIFLKIWVYSGGGPQNKILLHKAGCVSTQFGGMESRECSQF